MLSLFYKSLDLKSILIFFGFISNCQYKQMETGMEFNRIKVLLISLFISTLCSLLFYYPAYSASRGISIISDLSHQSGKLGAYRALIIGINDYKDPKIPDLETAINDAKAMAELLRKRYGFQVKLLLNRKATKKAIYQALRNLALSTKPDDSVLIYYAGHGDLDRAYNDGWWIPADAKGGDPVTYLDNGQVQKSMRSMKARHVLLISDSCYSGTLFGQARAMPQVIDDKYYLNLYNEKSRWGMTSGNKTPVSDRGSGGHSVFAYQLIKELRKNEKPYVSTQEIYTRIAPIVGNNSEQAPLCRPVRNTGDQGGEFVFVASSGAVIDEPAPKPSEAYLSVESNVSGAKVLVDGSYIGTTNLSGIKISPGEHRVRVEKNGYEPYSKRVRFKSGRKMSLTVVLDKKTAPKSSLYVDTHPNDAEVRILNIGQKFYQGIELKSGRYHVEVSADGYKTKKLWAILGSGEDKSIDVRLKRQVVTPSSSYSSAREIERDGRFVAYDNGTVKDTKTGLMWASKDNGEHINWKDAKRYCENYRGGGYTDWRLPTQDELAELYEPNTTNTNPSTGGCNGGYHINKLFNITCCCPWASETRGSRAATFDFGGGGRFWGGQSGSGDGRALPVRGGN